jgi:glycosyltransferase involved in cell wall biosynthesis
VSKIRVAIVHDWLIGGGAELVVEQLHKMYPDAPIYTSYCNNEWRKKLDGKVVTGYLQRWPFPSLRKFVPFLRGWWFSGLNLADFDLVISSSGAEAKFIKVKRGTKHVAYIHAPTHYYWSRYDEYLKNPGFGFLDPLARLGLKFLVGPMRRWDYNAAQRPDALIANSTYTKDQIKKYYGRDSEVIHPPVDTNYFRPDSDVVRKGFVIAGRQTAYKRFDLAVEACTQLDLALTVIGDGPDNKKIRKMAGTSVEFLGKISHEQVRECFRQAEGFIFPGVDDFGIVAVEAIATGTPVIAFGEGGALDYINPKTGMLFRPQTSEALQKVLADFQSKKFISKEISDQASNFSPNVFNKNLAVCIQKIISHDSPS